MVEWSTHSAYGVGKGLVIIVMHFLRASTSWFLSCAVNRYPLIRFGVCWFVITVGFTGVQTVLFKKHTVLSVLYVWIPLSLSLRLSVHSFKLSVICTVAYTNAIPDIFSPYHLYEELMYCRYATWLRVNVHGRCVVTLSKHLLPTSHVTGICHG